MKAQPSQKRTSRGSGKVTRRNMEYVAPSTNLKTQSPAPPKKKFQGFLFPLLGSTTATLPQLETGSVPDFFVGVSFLPPSSSIYGVGALSLAPLLYHIARSLSRVGSISAKNISRKRVLQSTSFHTTYMHRKDNKKRETAH